MKMAKCPWNRQEGGQTIFEGGGLVVIMEIKEIAGGKTSVLWEKAEDKQDGKGTAKSRAGCLCSVLFLKSWREGQVGQTEKRDR